jgi:soluble lytic murein transglycosylase-like protein
MPRFLKAPLLWLALTAFVLAAQPAAPVKPDAPSQQQAALAAMRDSLAKQRAALQKQTGQTESQGFFVLPPPTPMAPPSPLVAEPECDPLPAAQIDSLIGKAASRATLDPALVRSVIQQESGFRPCAVSAKGAMGLMQLMPATVEQFGVHNVFDPAENVDAGARLLKQLLVRYAGDLPKALAAYNAGPTTVDAAGGIPQIPETVDYIQRILALLPRM